MSLRRRRLLLFAPDHHGDCEIWGSHACSSPPAPPPLVPPPSPSPSPLSFAWPCPPLLPPSPSPALDGAVGRTNQGYGTAGGADDHRRRIVTIVLITAAALVFISLILLGVSVATRRRQQRRRRQQAALLAPATPAAVTNVEGGSGGGEGGGGGVVHHVWYIRTVGLDEAAIDSIAATRYRAGAGLLGAADCSVCLGEFQDGELVRLLPKCSHAFHVPCIDTWLRAHVNCPLCRSDVLGPIATVADEGSESSSTPRADPDADTVAAAEQAAATVDAISEHEGEQEEEDEQEAPRVEEDQQEQQFSLPEPSPQLLPSPPPRNVRRAASMDAAIVSAAVDVARLPEAAPEEEQRGGAKRDAGASCVKVSSSGHVGTERPPPPRSFFSRHCRARSSVLPL